MVEGVGVYYRRSCQVKCFAVGTSTGVSSWKQACVATMLAAVATCVGLDTRLSFPPHNSPRVYY